MSFSNISNTAISSDLLTSSDNVDSSDLKRLISLAGGSDSVEYEVHTFRASDNLVNLDFRKWHPDTLQQMVDTSVGNPLILDHNWGDSKSAVGLVVNSYIQRSRSTPGYQKLGYQDINSRIIQREGHIEVLMDVAIPMHQIGVINNIKAGVYKAVSTGGTIAFADYLCPHCSETHGREVSFLELDSKGEDYLCPHVIPSAYNTYFRLGEGVNLASYAVLKGDYQNHELSLVNIGNLPNARKL